MSPSGEQNTRLRWTAIGDRTCQGAVQLRPLKLRRGCRMCRPATIPDASLSHRISIPWILFALGLVLVLVTTALAICIGLLEHSGWPQWGLWGVLVLCAAASLELRVFSAILAAGHVVDAFVQRYLALGFLWNWTVCFASSGLLVARILAPSWEGVLATAAVGAGGGLVTAFLIERHLLSSVPRWSSRLSQRLSRLVAFWDALVDHRKPLGYLRERVPPRREQVRMDGLLRASSPWEAVCASSGPLPAWNSKSLAIARRTRRVVSVRFAGTTVRRSGERQRRKHLVSRLRHYRVTDGGDLVEIRSVAVMAEGERVRFIHHAFCPPFRNTPVVRVQVLEGKGVRVKLARCYPFGIRIELRRNDAHARQRIVLGIQAASGK